MALTMVDAMTAEWFHENHGPTGKIVRWHRNGKTMVWKTRPGEYRIPVKHGLYEYGYIYHTDAGRFHTEDSCDRYE